MPKPKTKYDISLWLEHPDYDVDEITRVLGIKPANSWRTGEKRRTPKGAPLDGTYDSSYWMAPLGEGSPSTLARSLHKAARMLRAHLGFVNNFISSGGKVNLAIGYFVRGNAGETFDSSLLRELSDTGTGLLWFFYPPD